MDTTQERAASATHHTICECMWMSDAMTPCFLVQHLVLLLNRALGQTGPSMRAWASTQCGCKPASNRNVAWLSVWMLVLQRNPMHLTQPCSGVEGFVYRLQRSRYSFEDPHLALLSRVLPHKCTNTLQHSGDARCHTLPCITSCKCMLPANDIRIAALPERLILHLPGATS